MNIALAVGLKNLPARRQNLPWENKKGEVRDLALKWEI
jgi:hypothetical protein